MKFVVFIFSALFVVNIGGSTLIERSKKLAESQPKCKFTGIGISKAQSADIFAFATSDNATFYLNKNLVNQSILLKNMLHDNPNVATYDLLISADNFAVLARLLEQADLEHQALLRQKNPPMEFWDTLSFENIKLAALLYEQYEIPLIKQRLLETIGKALANPGFEKEYKKELLDSLTPHLKNLLESEIISTYLGSKYIKLQNVQYNIEGIDTEITGDSYGPERYAYITITESQNYLHERWTQNFLKLSDDKFQKIRYSLDGVFFFGIGTKKVGIYITPSNVKKIIDFSHSIITAFAVGPNFHIAVATENGVISILKIEQKPFSSLTSENIWETSMNNRYAKLLAFPTNNNALLALVDSKNSLAVLDIQNKKTSHENPLPTTDYLDMIFVNQNKWILLISKTSILILDWQTGKKIAIKDFSTPNQPFFGDAARLKKENNNIISIYHFGPKKGRMIEQKLNLNALIQKYPQFKEDPLLAWKEAMSFVFYTKNNLTDRLKSSYNKWLNYWRPGLTTKQIKQSETTLD